MPIQKIDGAKKNGLQKYRVRFNYTDSLGNYRQIERTAYGLDAAKDLELKLPIEISAASAPAKVLTLQNLYDEYINQKKHTVRESTLQKEIHIIERHILPTLGPLKIKKITLPVLQNWKNGIEEKSLSLTMRQNIYQPLNSILNYAVKMDYLPSNLLKKLGRFRDPYAGKADIDFYTIEEWKEYRLAAEAAAQEKGFYEWNFFVFFSIAFLTGLRKGEIYALKWTDLSGNRLYVRRSINQKLKGPDRETPPKNKSSIRDIELPKSLMKVLKDHKKRYSAVPGFSEDWRICGGLEPLRDSTVTNRNISYSKAAEIKKIRIHDFRHSHASLLANEGINIQEIARRLGHAKVDITWNTYSHLYPREEERATKVLDSI